MLILLLSFSHFLSRTMKIRFRSGKFIEKGLEYFDSKRKRTRSVCKAFRCERFRDFFSFQSSCPEIITGKKRITCLIDLVNSALIGKGEFKGKRRYSSAVVLESMYRSSECVKMNSSAECEPPKGIDLCK